MKPFAFFLDQIRSMKRYVCVAAVLCLEVACSKSPQSYVERGNRLMAAGKYADAELQYRESISKDPKFAEGYYRLGLIEYKFRHGGEALEDLQRAVDFAPGNDTYAVELANISVEAYQAVPGRKNLYDQAVQEADALLKKDPNSFDGLRLRGDVLVLDRKYDDALAEFRKANAVHPNEPNVLLAMAQVLFAQKRDREAEELIQQFLAVRKDFPPVYDLLESDYVRTKRLVDAEHLLQLEIAALPKDARPRLQLANLYRTSGRYKEMSQELQKLLSDRADFPEGAALVGDFYAGAEKWDDALAAYRAGIQTSTNKEAYHKRMERALEALGKRQEALGELDEILKTNPKDSDARLTRAVLLRQSKDPKERDSAIVELKSLAAQDPNNTVVHYNLGLSYWNKGDAASAWQELKKSADLRKDYLAPRLVLADIAQTAHNYPAALQEAGEALALDPNNAGAKLLRAAALVGTKSYRQAASELDELSRAQPNSKEVGLQLADLALAQKDYAKAEALYRRFYQPGSADLRPLQGLLQICAQEGHPAKAQSLLEEDLKKEPDSQPVRLLLASVATSERKFDLASEQYRWIQSKDPKSVPAYSALGDLYQLQGDTGNALASYEKARELAPKDPKILNAIALLESNGGQAQQAIATLNQQLRLDPNNAAAMNNLAFNLAETGTDLDRALALAEGVARKFPNDPAVTDTLGWVYAKRGLNQSAIKVLSILVKKYPKEPAFRYHLAMVLLQNKQPSDAKLEFLTALSQHPPKELSSKIQENLAQLR
jgi:tetratricopeptide (TPR) repeat protein